MFIKIATEQHFTPSLSSLASYLQIVLLFVNVECDFLILHAMHLPDSQLSSRYIPPPPVLSLTSPDLVTTLCFNLFSFQGLVQKTFPPANASHMIYIQTHHYAYMNYLLRELYFLVCFPCINAVGHRS